MAKRKRKPTQKMQISIDEFERNDLTLLTAVMFPDHVVSRFQREWRVLQMTIRAELRRKYPFAQKAEMQVEAWLPEIHAKELYQSQKIYRNDETRHPGYWREHRRWLAEAVAIIRRANPTILVIPYRQELVEINRQILGLPTETWAKEVPYKNMREKMDRLFQSPYVWGLNHLIDTIEAYLEAHDLHADLICDQHGDGYGFSMLRIFEIAGKESETSRMPSPTFASSDDHALLQAADVVAYVFGSVLCDSAIGKLRPDIVQWASSLSPLERRVPPSKNVDLARSTARIFEYLIRYSGGPNAYREKLSVQIEDFVAMSVADKDVHLYLDAEGLQYGIGPEMYKAPSGDGALSDVNLPRSSEGVKIEQSSRTTVEQNS